MLTEERLGGAKLRVAGMIVVALFIFAVFAWAMAGGSIFQRKETLFTYVPDSGGIDNGAPVRMNGLPVGAVSEVALTHSRDLKREIRVKLRIQRRYLDLIPEDSTTGISSDNILGDKYLEIERGKSPRAVKAEGELAFVPPGAMFNQADLLKTFAANMAQIDALLADIQLGKSQVGQLVMGEALYDELNAKVGQIAKQIDVMASPKGVFGQMVYGDEFYAQTIARIRQIDDRIAAIQSNPMLTGTADYDRLRNNVAAFRRTLQDVRAGKGQAGALVESDELYASMNKLADSLNGSVEALSTGQGQLGQMLVSPRLYESLEGRTRGIQTFLRELRTNPQKFLRIQMGF